MLTIVTFGSGEPWLRADNTCANVATAPFLSSALMLARLLTSTPLNLICPPVDALTVMLPIVSVFGVLFVTVTEASPGASSLPLPSSWSAWTFMLPRATVTSPSVTEFVVGPAGAVLLALLTTTC